MNFVMAKGPSTNAMKSKEIIGLIENKNVNVKCNLYFKSVYKLQETRATKAKAKAKKVINITLKMQRTK